MSTRKRARSPFPAPAYWSTTSRLRSARSRSGPRPLPLLGPVTAALDALQARQMEEQGAADSAYANSGYVVADELGQPFGIEQYADEFARIANAAALPRVRLHATRATMNAIFEAARVS